MPTMGFDFGTTNSVASIISDEKAVVLDAEGSTFPSMVCYEGSKILVGAAAKARLAGPGLGVQGHVVRSPKTMLGKEHVYVEGVEHRPIDIVAEVIRFVRDSSVQRYEKLFGEAAPALDKAIATIPINMDGRRRAELREAFQMAGISVVQFVHEPLAALYAHFRGQAGSRYAVALRQFDRKLLLVCDWGGGTLDLTLCRMGEGSLVQVLNDGLDEVGGDLFDERLKNEVERRFRTERALGPEVRVQASAGARLMHACEQAKILLSYPSLKPEARIFVSNYFHGLADPDLDYSLTRSDMDGIVKDLVDQGLGRLEQLLVKGRFSPATIAMCLVTGGMSNLGTIRSRLNELFGPQRVTASDQGGTLIAQGAAWVAHDHAKLLLAKTVELRLARNTTVPIIDAYSEMPRGGHVQAPASLALYCADPRDGLAKIQLQAPLRPGKPFANDERRFLLSLTVNVDAKARPFRERLQLDVRIDDNLILHAKASSDSHAATGEVHDLEFALGLPQAQDLLKKDGQDEGDWPAAPQRHEPGDVVLRTNLALTEDNFLVPGELLEQVKPTYFNPSRRPPELQVEEALYYRPCAVCGRGFNDPACCCAS